MPRYLIDTDVLIEYLRGRERAAKFLEGIEGELMISAVTVAELFSGVGLIRQQYHPSHGTGLADALIATTALDRQARLVTFNQCHYPMLSYVVQPYRR